ncbi:MAG: hypothetical protein HY525_00455 [Betaproteobacteria bacterium]|nr:hypothetical protein [Betaproteobacteria bacterium]
MLTAERHYLDNEAKSVVIPGYDIEVTNVIPEVDEISSGGALADLILSCDKALFL